MCFEEEVLNYSERITNNLFDIGSITKINQQGSSLNIRCSQGYLTLTFYRDDILRVSMNPKATPRKDESIAIVASPANIETQFLDNENEATFESSKLKVVIDKEPTRLTIYQGNRVLASESSFGLAHDGQRHVVCYKKLESQDRFYGFGEKTGFLDKRGRKMEMWNTDVFPHSPDVDRLYQSIPFFITLRADLAYGIFVDHTGLTTFDFKSSNDFYSFSADNDQLDYYLFAGPKPADVLEQYTYLTGRMSLPPKWAMGYQQARYSYETQAEVEEIVSTFKAKDIPLDAIYLDIHYMDGYRIFTFDRQRFPAYKQLIKDLAREGIHTVPIVDPGVKVDADYDVYLDGIANDVFCRYPDGRIFTGRVWPGVSAFPDFTSKKVREWWKKRNRFYTDLGIDGLWNDMNEPAIFGEAKCVDMDHNVMHQNDGNPKTHRALHNIYGMQMAASTHQALLEQTKKRPFVLTRAGYAGIQRYATVWTGDNNSFWEHLQLSLSMCMNMGLSGIAFCGADVGGFGSDTDPELLTRWYEAATFIPFFRNHSTFGSRKQEPWAFDPQTEEIIRQCIKLRYSWLPHWNNLFWECCQTGTPLMRPLFFHYPADPHVVNLNDEFLLGSDVLVAPIMQPGLTHRSVYLPAGIWYNYFTGEKYSGNRHILAEGLPGKVPLFIRGGSLIALTEPKSNTSQLDTVLELHLFFAEGSSSYTLYEEDGYSLEYQEGDYFHAEIDAHCLKDELDLHFKTLNKGYQPSWKQIKLVVHGLPEDMLCRVNGQEVPLTSGSSLVNWDSQIATFTSDFILNKKN